MGGPSAAAPGADDNGSGSAGLLELARVLSSRQWGHDLRFILFGGEEEGLHGSRQYVAALPPANDPACAPCSTWTWSRPVTLRSTVLLEGASRLEGSDRRARRGRGHVHRPAGGNVAVTIRQ